MSSIKYESWESDETYLVTRLGNLAIDFVVLGLDGGFAVRDGPEMIAAHYSNSKGHDDCQDIN
jgi:hypothetical protein